MALIKCPKCGKMFSEHAAKCPRCGLSINDVARITKENEEKRIYLEFRVRAHY